MQLVHRERRSRGSETHLARGCEIFVFIRTDRAAPLAALLSPLSIGKTHKHAFTARGEKTRVKAHSSDGKALWGILQDHRLWVNPARMLVGMSRLVGAERKSGSVSSNQPLDQSCQQSLP